MGKLTVRCPACDGRIEEARGFYSCETHGIMPYDYVVGNIDSTKALGMMANWGVVAKVSKRAQRKAANPQPTGTVAELLKQLGTATNKADKRKLRAALRKAGHVGGLKS